MADAIVLLSGGLDSATCLAIARDEGFACHCVSFDYGQRHRGELDAAARVAEHLGATSHRTVRLDPAAFAGSALTTGGAVPKHDDPDAELGDAIPPTYVPARNTVFLSYALGIAEVAGAHDLYLGVNALDYSGYPDCRPEYIAAFQAMARLATRDQVEGGTPLAIHTPLLHLTKAQIIRRGRSLGVDYTLTRSCYDPLPPDDAPCGRCDACLLRARGFREADA